MSVKEYITENRRYLDLIVKNSATHTWKYIKYELNNHKFYANIWKCIICGMEGTSEDVAPDSNPIASSDKFCDYSCNEIVLRNVLK
jgi:hypothetical protein